MQGAPAAGAGAGPAVRGVAPDSRGAAGGGRLAAGGMAQQGAQREPMATLDALLQAHLTYNAIEDDDARAAFLRERKGFKASPGEPFRDGPGSLGVFARMFDAVLRIATTTMVGRLYGVNEDLGFANFLSAFEGDALGLARTTLADTPASDNAALRLHSALMSLLRAYLPPRAAQQWRETCGAFVGRHHHGSPRYGSADMVSASMMHSPADAAAPGHAEDR